jgi:hypothetical protein
MDLKSGDKSRQAAERKNGAIETARNAGPWKIRALWARWIASGRSDQGRFVFTQRRAIWNDFPFMAQARETEAWRKQSDRIVSLIDQWHAGAEAIGAVMMVVIRRALIVMRIEWTPVIVIITIVIAMIIVVLGSHDIAWVCNKVSALYADQQADNHEGLEKNAHHDGQKILVDEPSRQGISKILASSCYF